MTIESDAAERAMRNWTALAWLAFALEALCLSAAGFTLLAKTGLVPHGMGLMALSVSAAGLLAVASGQMLLRDEEEHAPEWSAILGTLPVRVWGYGCVLIAIYLVVLNRILL